MQIDLKIAQKALCDSLCSSVTLEQFGNDLIAVRTPFQFADGDEFQIYVRSLERGGLRVTDMGHTLMQLSYSIDIDSVRRGAKASMLSQTLNDSEVSEVDGELFIDVTSDRLGSAVLRLGQCITSILDISFLQRSRSASSFYDDLEKLLTVIVPAGKLHKEYYIKDLDRSSDYPIDFMIDSSKCPVFVFGVPNRDKAKLVTIVLEHSLRHEVDFESIVIFQDQQEIERKDLARLSNVGGEMIASLDATEDLQRKILRKLAA